jgi:hypothetical protein
MSLCYREQRQLRGIEADLLQSDSHLTAMLYVFDRLYGGQDMPASEQVPSGQDRDRRAVTRIAVAFAVAALAISILFSAALTLPARYGAPASGHRPPGPSAPGPARKPMASRTLPDRPARVTRPTRPRPHPAADQRGITGSRDDRSSCRCRDSQQSYRAECFQGR